jgi:membrane-associated protease RseP (regulator of RpoE activity)
MEDALFQDRPRARLPVVPAALFLATVLTTALVGGFTYSAAVLAILGAHEMGHYVLARWHRVDSSLPHFLPLPLPPFGTLGAVIRIRSRLPSRTATLEIGAAGPIAGFIVALPLLFWGYAHAELVQVDLPAAQGASLLDLVRGWLAHGFSGGGPAGDWAVFGDSLLTKLVERLVMGARPPGTDVLLTPIGKAAWLGLMVTALNLIPIGQLDGGHVMYAWLGRARARRVGQVFSAALLAGGIFVHITWLVWWALTRFVVRLDHPPALLDEEVTLARKAIAVLCLVLLAITFIPVPIS